MTLPPNLLAEAEAAAVEQFAGDAAWMLRNGFTAGVQWFFSRLCEMSEAEFDEKAVALEAGFNTADIKELHGTSCPALLEYAKRIARHQHKLNQAALLKAREELTAKDLLISQMRMQLSMTNSSWPHENKLHEELSAKRARAAEDLRVAREEIAGLKHASVTVAVELTEAWNKERARAERLGKALNWIANNASSFGLEGESYVERARQALAGDGE